MANIVYWYGMAHAPLEGYGQRAIAWHGALTGALSLQRSIQLKAGLAYLNTEAAVDLPVWISERRAAKRHLLKRGGSR